MNSLLPLQDDKKLSVTYRVEPGCLGPEGASHVVKFCGFAHAELQSLDSDTIVLNIVPRADKMLPEMEYSIVGKKINYAQAEQYLAAFGQSLDDFECQLSDRLANLIDDFMGH
jgi:hypothetical protein